MGGNPAWNLSPPGRRMDVMDILITVGAILTGLATVTVGMFSLLSIWLDDIV